MFTQVELDSQQFPPLINPWVAANVHYESVRSSIASMVESVTTPLIGHGLLCKIAPTEFPPPMSPLIDHNLHSSLRLSSLLHCSLHYLHGRVNYHAWSTIACFVWSLRLISLLHSLLYCCHQSAISCIVHYDWFRSSIVRSNAAVAHSVAATTEFAPPLFAQLLPLHAQLPPQIGNSLLCMITPTNFATPFPPSLPPLINPWMLPLFATTEFAPPLPPW